ncbi:cell division protein ZapA [Arenicella chitinivorans]|uniref:Cell division protein ZapA n=1 Tax=Arenicella chitinivorans TaxID=1329800 RepID=A0A918RKV1_9GAMM|nr:cell division protein ZapA [Arenicella chitinivorans]GHA04002.1 cell division protein ZapA [Arenicella chitinivorans]
MAGAAQNRGINISIMGRDFSVACPPEEQEDLLEAAQFLDKNMKEIQKTGKIIGAERCAIMAALNITNDLLKLQKSTAGQDKVQARLSSLQERIDEVLRDAESS